MTQHPPPLATSGAPAPKKSNTTLIVIGVIAGALVVMLFCGGILAALLLPALAKARVTAQDIKAQVSMRELAAAVDAYLQDHEGLMPPADDWSAALRPYLQGGTGSRGPLNPSGGRMFAMNDAIGSVTLTSVKFPDRTVMFFEVDEGGPDVGGAELLSPRPRVRQGYLVLTADGSIQHIPQEQTGALIW